MSATKFHCLNTSMQQSCSEINYLSNGINILAEDEPIPVKFWPKFNHLQQEGCAFHVSRVERCAVGVSRPCNNRYKYEIRVLDFV